MRKEQETIRMKRYLNISNDANFTIVLDFDFDILKKH